MAFPYGLFIALYGVSMVVGVFLGLLVVVGWKEMSSRKTLISARYNIVYLMILVGMPLVTLLENIARGPSDATKEIIYTNWIFSISGNAIKILQDRLDYAIVADFFIIVYVWIFTYIIYFTPILILAKGDNNAFRRYSIAMLFNYVVLIPFYIFFPVSVTGFFAGAGVKPLLYMNTNWGRMVSGVDPLDNDFPSAHVSLVMTTVLVLVAAGLEYRRYYYFLMISAGLITFSVLYLGVHWPADVFAGFLLAIGATLFASSEKIDMTIDRWVRKLSARVFEDDGDTAKKA